MQTLVPRHAKLLKIDSRKKGKEKLTLKQFCRFAMFSTEIPNTHFDLEEMNKAFINLERRQDR